MKKDKHHNNFFFLFDKERKCHIVEGIFGTDEEKYACFKKIREIIKEHNINVAINIFEAWFVEARDRRNIMVRASQHPGRQEILLIMMCSRDGLKHSTIMPFKRTESGDIVFIEERNLDLNKGGMIKKILILL